MREQHDTRIELKGYMRSLLLTEICRHGDVIDSVNSDYNLELQQVRGSNFQGKCPWCGQSNTFSMNKRSGACNCSYCGESGDYLDLLCQSRGDTLAQTLDFLTLLLQNNDRCEADWRREKRRRRRQLQGGAA